MIDTSLRQSGSIEVEAPARLHLGFIDLSGASGRRFGSLGLTLEGLSTRLVAEKSKANSIQGPQSQRTLQYLNALQERFSLPKGTKIVVKAAIPAHSGLGSGTQLAIAVGVGPFQGRGRFGGRRYRREDARARAPLLAVPWRR